jgi:hypothetical protein
MTQSGHLLRCLLTGHESLCFRLTQPVPFFLGALFWFENHYAIIAAWREVQAVS